MQRQEITVWETKCYVWSSDVTVLDVLTANTHHQLLTEADRCKISIHAEETKLCMQAPISEMHDTAVGWGGGVMVSGTLTTGQMYCTMLGKQKDKAKNSGGWLSHHGA